MALFKTLGTLIRTLVERMQKSNTVGLDIRLLNELVRAGINCPAFNPRMKYSLAWWSQDQKGIESLDYGWCLCFPFDTLTYLPGHPSAAKQVRKMVEILSSFERSLIHSPIDTVLCLPRVPWCCSAHRERWSTQQGYSCCGRGRPNVRNILV